ncbi:MAG: iron-containing alcohol dehydrogenase, partial [Anaerolineae bacterium]|nr:iron-containing alcohol dehydrogenase [Anaerolineae bacterium]
MSKVKSFVIPTVMKHGLGAISTLAGEVRDLGLKRPLIVTDPGLTRAGLLERAVVSLKASNIDYVVFDQVVPNPPIEMVDSAAALYRNERCDGVIGLGGGSSMDTAKSVGVVV